MANIKECAVVELKSGGVLMTVGRIYNAGASGTPSAEYYWFDSKMEYHQQPIPVTALEARSA